MQSNFEQDLHDDFVDLIGQFLKQRGFNRIMSALYGMPQPPTINGVVPDVYAEKIEINSEGFPVITGILIVDVETKATKKEPETASKHKALKVWAKEHKAEFRTVTAR